MVKLQHFKDDARTLVAEFANEVVGMTVEQALELELRISDLINALYFSESEVDEMIAEEKHATVLEEQQISKDTLQDIIATLGLNQNVCADCFSDIKDEINLRIGD